MSVSRSRTAARSLAALLPAVALALAPLTPAGAGARPEVIAFPTGVQPEGIAAGPGTTFFAGAINGGTIYRGDVRTGALTPFVERSGTAAIGMAYDAATRRLWVAGGPTGTVTAYDGRTGEQVFATTVSGAGFLNDVAVTRDAVYVTDSGVPQLVVVPLGAGGALPDESEVRTLAVTGDFVQTGAFGLNGIRALPGGLLVAVDSETGDLLRIDPASGVATRIVQTGQDLVSGDGLELRGRTLYVVNGDGDGDASIVALKLSGDASTAQRTATLVDDDLARPSTAALVAGDLYAVNARFGQPLTVDRQVVRVDLR